MLAEIQTLAAAQLRLKRPIQASDEIVRDLNLDSVELITLAASIEEHFHIDFAPADSANLRTIGDLCRLVIRGQAASC